jgi:MFS family permease
VGLAYTIHREHRLGGGRFIRAAEAVGKPVFEEVRRAQEARRLPVVDVLRAEGRTVLLAAGSYLAISATGYLVIVYFVSYATRNLQFPLGATLALLQVAAIVFAASTVYFANRSDCLGRRRMMLWGSAGLIFASLVFFPLIDTKSMLLAELSLCFLLLVQGAYIGPQAAVFAESFAPPVRYSGASLSITIGTIFGGAIAPFLATALYGAAGNSWPITIYAVVLSVISWMCSLGLRNFSYKKAQKTQKV